MSKDNFDEKVEEMQKNELIAAQFEQNKSKAEDLLKDKDKMERLLERLENKLDKVPFAGKYLSDVPVLISLVKAYIEKEYTEIPVGSIIAVVGALIYVLSPIDISPDIIPAIGLVDDAAVIAMAYTLVHDDIVEYKAWREAKKRNEMG